jgi:hypothetical protein
VALPESAYYVGIDRGRPSTRSAPLTEADRVKTEFAITHTAVGFAGLIRRLAELGQAEDIRGAVGRPDGHQRLTTPPALAQAV